MVFGIYPVRLDPGYDPGYDPDLSFLFLLLLSPG
jgi:hypothetical protein